MPAIKCPSQADMDLIEKFLREKCNMTNVGIVINGSDSWSKLVDQGSGKIVATMNLWRYREDIGLSVELFNSTSPNYAVNA